MNNVVAIIFLVILAVLLFFIIRAIIPAFTQFLRDLPKGIFVLLLVVVLALMGYLVYFLVTSNSKTGGNPGNPEAEVVDQEEQRTENGNSEKLKNCIILREDDIIIDNMSVDMDYVEKYIDEHVENNIEIIIADDYSTSELHHRITDLCIKKGVKFTTKDEKEIEQ